MEVLLYPTYFPNTAQFAAITQANYICFEACGNYQKQTYRNRTYIFGANGKLVLNVPVIHTHKNRQLYKDVKIANETKWQLQHWKSLQSAYRTSPFFEYYEDDLAPLFHKPKTFIFDFNLECLDQVCECLQLDIHYSKTKIYEAKVDNLEDLRPLADMKKDNHYSFSTYTQVFSLKHGFIPNLSILDVLFNEGPNAIDYLEAQSLNS